MTLQFMSTVSCIGESQVLFSYILTGKRNATVKFRHILFVAHKHELHKLTITRILSQASGLF